MLTWGVIAFWGDQRKRPPYKRKAADVARILGSGEHTRVRAVKRIHTPVPATDELSSRRKDRFRGRGPHDHHHATDCMGCRNRPL